MATTDIVVQKTTYKVGEMLYGQNSLNARVDKVNSDQSIDIQFIPPREGTAYYYLSSGTRKTSTWTRVPSDSKIKGLDADGYIKFKIEYDSLQVVEKSLYWWGNYYANDYIGAKPRIIYGDPPYGVYYIPSDTSQTTPTKPPSWDASYWGLGSEWTEVPGSYKWERKGNFDEFYGWSRKNNYGPSLNRYRKKIVIQYQKGSKGAIESGEIKLTKFNDDVNKTVEIPELVLLYNHRITKGKNKISGELKNDHLKLLLDGVDYTNANEEVSINYEFSNTPIKETGGKIMNPTIIVFNNGVDNKGKIVKSRIPNLPIGKHNVTLQCNYQSDNTEGRVIFIEKKFEIEIIDNTSAVPAKIIDNRGNECKDTLGNPYIYDNDKTTIYTIINPTGGENKPGLQPTWIPKVGQNYEATYDYYRFLDDGFEVELVKSKVQFTAGSIEFTETGQYHIRVTTNYLNSGASAVTEAICIIDNRIPDPVIIVINSEDEYTGKFDNTLLKSYLNTASITFKVPKNCKMIKGDTKTVDGMIMYEDIGIERKQSINDTFKDILDDHNKNLPVENQIFNIRGTYKIAAKCKNIKTLIESPLSTVEFKIKRRQTYKISLSTEQPTYMVKVHVNFYGDTAVDSANAFDQHLYRIDKGEWKHYLDDVMIFKNCLFECKSIDEDGFESYTSSMEIKNISSRTPDLPKISYRKADGEEGNIYELVNNTTLSPYDTLIISLEKEGGDK